MAISLPCSFLSKIKLEVNHYVNWQNGKDRRSSTPSRPSSPIGTVLCRQKVSGSPRLSLARAPACSRYRAAAACRGSTKAPLPLQRRGSHLLGLWRDVYLGRFIFELENIHFWWVMQDWGTERAVHGFPATPSKPSTNTKSKLSGKQGTF